MGVTQAYYSACLVVISTQDNGYIDVSDDVMQCSVSRRLDAVSSAEVTLNNFSGYMSGRYNGLLHIGDRVHIAFLKNTSRIDQLTGRISQVPVAAFNTSSYSFTVTDVIQDLQYVYWDPWSTKAIERYTAKSTDIVDAASIAGNQDSGLGNELYDFLTNVCGLDSSMIKVAKFPDATKTMQAIVDMTVNAADVNIDATAEQLYKAFFGSGTMGSDVSGASSSTIDPAKSGSMNDVANYVMKALTGIIGGSATNGNISAGKIAFKSGINWGAGSSAATGIASNTGISTTSGLASNKWESWKSVDGANHTGLYGLTKSQMSKYSGKNSEAKDCSKAAQDKAIRGVINSIWRSGIKTVDKALWFYLCGQAMPATNSSGNITYRQKSKIRLSGTEITTLKNLHKFTAVKSNTAATDSSSSKSTTKSADANRKWDAFTSTYGAGKAAQDYEGLGTQCWCLYESYCMSIFGWKIGDGDWSYQGKGGPTGVGNGAYYSRAMTIPKISSNFIKLDANAKAKKGDVAFWSRTNSEYGHVAIVLADKGDSLEVLQQWAGCGTVRDGMIKKNGGGYVFAGYLRPKMFSDGLSSDSTSASDSSSSSGVSEAYNDTFKMFKFLTFDNQTEIANSTMLGGNLSLKNDKPALDFVSSLCKASMRSFMSLPDGSFAAFVPDWFGKMMPSNAANNTITIDPIDMVSFKTVLDKSSYVSHYFLTTNEANPNAYGLSNAPTVADMVRSLYSSGTVTMEEQADNLLSLMDISATGCKTTAELMNKWGVSVKTETDNYIQDSTMTSISALFRFLKYWANCFKTSVQLTFRPELMPGIRLYIPQAGMTVFVESVTHSWSSTSGGSTSVSTVAPVTNGKAGSTIIG